eukprot:s1241_g8.t1
MLDIKVALPSGHCEDLSVSESSKVGDLRILAQKSFGQGFLRLIADGRILTDEEPLPASAGHHQLTAIALEAKVAGTSRAFALWCYGGDRILTWGYPAYGGDSSAVQERLKNVQQIEAAATAFAAILPDGSVVSWGHPDSGGDSSAVQDQLKNVQQLQATDSAFAAILADGSVVTWGDQSQGGDSSAVLGELKEVVRVHASCYAFTAVLADGSIVTWGDQDSGGDSSAVRDQVRSPQQLQSTESAFAALTDGSVVTWGNESFGGDSSAVQDQLRHVQQLEATDFAFAAIIADGSVVTWGVPDLGGDSSAVQDQLKDVQKLQATHCAFAAVLANGSVVAWGSPDEGGDTSEVQDQLQNVQEIQSTGRAFAAILADRSVVTWGSPADGGDSSAVQDQLRNVLKVAATERAFVAILAEGSEHEILILSTPPNQGATLNISGVMGSQMLVAYLYRHLVYSICWCARNCFKDGVSEIDEEAFSATVGEFFPRGPDTEGFTPQYVVAGVSFDLMVRGDRLTMKDRILVPDNSISCGDAETAHALAFRSHLCGRGDSACIATPGNGPPTGLQNMGELVGESGISFVQTVWSPVQIDTPGTYRICWCVDDSWDPVKLESHGLCGSGFQFNVQAGLIVVQGSDGDQRFQCTSFQPCNLNIISELPFESGDRIMVVAPPPTSTNSLATVCGRGTTGLQVEVGAFHSIYDTTTTSPPIFTSTLGANETTTTTEPQPSHYVGEFLLESAGQAGLYRLCYCKNAELGPCDDPVAFAQFAGILNISGKDCLQQDELFDLEGRCRYPAAELCMKTCGLCDRVRMAKRCEVSPRCYPFCAPTTDWAAFLEAAVHRWNSRGSGRLLHRDPAIAEFPDFLSPLEAETLISIAHQSGFQLEDPNDMPPEHRDVNKVDCEKSHCLRDPLIQEIYRRVSELLGIPPQNFESIEFLLYNRGQHYKPHLDDGPWQEMPALSAGLRVLTVFFYLSEAKKGGETRFPKVDLLVEPSAGKAVVWANVQADIWKMEKRSLHQAVPVVEGTKIAANFWVHPFEYRAAERFCKVGE